MAQLCRKILERKKIIVLFMRYVYLLGVSYSPKVIVSVDFIYEVQRSHSHLTR
jgi:hypothetical protein